MRFSISRRRFLASSILGGVYFAATAGCGTILHPERRGQPPGRLDWGVVVLNGLGLFLFLIPGIIAFAVDFSNGTIYLPPEEQPVPLMGAEQGASFSTIVLPPGERSPRAIAKALAAHTGKEIKLEEGAYYATELHGLENFWNAAEDLLALHDPGHVRDILRAQSP